MGDFDFGFSEEPREPNYDRRPRPSEGRYDYQKRRQGFSEPYDESPFSNPPGWYGGAVRQTGGMVMVREWSTTPNHELYKVHDSRPARRYEYEVAYGDNPGVSIQRYEWDPRSGTYVFDGVVDEERVGRNTDQAKARAARELMREHSGKTR
jgi:hypothetical protein